MAEFEEEAVQGEEGNQASDGLDRGGYHYPHGKQYYKDGRICEPPKKIEPNESAASTAGEVETNPNNTAAASQSKWNFDDYHWEERDIIGLFTPTPFSSPQLYICAYITYVILTYIYFIYIYKFLLLLSS